MQSKRATTEFSSDGPSGSSDGLLIKYSNDVLACTISSVTEISFGQKVIAVEIGPLISWGRGPEIEKEADENLLDHLGASAEVRRVTKLDWVNFDHYEH